MAASVRDDARGCVAIGTVRLVVENAGDAALRVTETRVAVRTASRSTALVALERAADITVFVRSIDARDTIAASRST